MSNELETRLKLIEIEQNAILHALEKKLNTKITENEQKDISHLKLILASLFFNLVSLYLIIDHLIKASP